MNVTKFAQRHLRRHIYTSAKRSLLLLSSASAYLYAHFSLAPFISRGFLRRRAVIDSSTRRARSAANHRPDKSSSRFSDSAERGFPHRRLFPCVIVRADNRDFGSMRTFRQVPFCSGWFLLSAPEIDIDPGAVYESACSASRVGLHHEEWYDQEFQDETIILFILAEKYLQERDNNYWKVVLSCSRAALITRSVIVCKYEHMSMWCYCSIYRLDCARGRCTYIYFNSECNSRSIRAFVLIFQSIELFPSACAP